MKTAKNNNQDFENIKDVAFIAEGSAADISFDMSVYNELSDHPMHSLDVLSMLNKQIQLAHEMSARRTFLLKEISPYFKK